MPDVDGNTKAETAEGTDTVTDTSLHAYKDGREEDMKGDKEQILSEDPQKQQRKDLVDPDEDLRPDKH